MARSLHANTVTELTAIEKRPILLTHFEFDSGDLRLWTGMGDLVWDNNTFTGSGSLLSVASITETAESIATGLTFTLSGISTAIIALVDGEDYQQRLVHAYIGFLDSTGAVISEPFEIFRGRMDTMTDLDDGETATVVLTAENILTDMERAVIYRYTPEDQKLINASDTFFDFVASLQELEIVGDPVAKGVKIS